jgi:putative protein kinase ArgK-like GTPase of G3E family
MAIYSFSLTCADLIILVLQPGTGDVIQALKAGIIEAADLFLINKADLPGADTLPDSLRFLFDNTPIPMPRVPISQNVEISIVANLSRGYLQLRFWWGKRMIHSLIFSLKHFPRVHF